MKNNLLNLFLYVSNIYVDNILQKPSTILFEMSFYVNFAIPIKNGFIFIKTFVYILNVAFFIYLIKYF